MFEIAVDSLFLPLYGFLSSTYSATCFLDSILVHHVHVVACVSLQSSQNIELGHLGPARRVHYLVLDLISSSYLRV